MSNARRSKQFVDTRVQGALARRIIEHWVAFFLVAGAVSFLLQVLSNPFQPVSNHARELWWTHGPFLVVMVFLLPVFILDTIKLSNRFAGPVYNLRRAMQEIAEGKPPRKLKFRRHDFWHDLAEDYNKMLAKLDLLENEEPVEAEEQLAGTGH